MIVLHILKSNSSLFRYCIIEKYRPAFCIGILGWVICGTALCLMSLTVCSDEANVHQQRAKMRIAQKM